MIKKITPIASMLFLCLFLNAKAQINNGAINPSPFALSGYLTEGFENVTFPPVGWQSQSAQGNLVWTRSTAQQKSGLASAYMGWEAMTVTGEDFLIMPKFSVAATDSLVFWLAAEFVGFPPDSLIIMVSTTDSALASFTTSIYSLWEGGGYPTVINTFERHAVSLSAYSGQQIYVAFRNINTYGDGIYIDDVALGTPPANDVSSLSIDMPVDTGLIPLNPKATFKNVGSAPQSFNVTMNINGGYSSTMPVASLVPNATQQITFGTWYPASAGTYTVTVYTQLAGDANTSNDTLTATINVYPALLHFGWSAKPPMAAGRLGLATASSHAGIFPNDTSHIYEFGGNDGTTIVTQCSDFSTETNSWNSISDISLGRVQFTAQTVNGKIYLIGGYNPNFSPVNNNDIYDIASGTWSTGASMPSPVGDYASAVYNDSLIYYICGYGGAVTGDMNAVSIYNPFTDTWSSGTPMSGTPAAALRCGIYGNKIVLIGGYSQTAGALVSQAMLGVIDPSNPTNITWSALPDYPGGIVGRPAGGAVYQQLSPLIIFTGGDPTTTGTGILNETWAYDLMASTWRIGPPKITGVNNLGNFVGALYNDSVYMVSVGGYDGTAVSGNNEWLNLGPVNSLGIGQSNSESLYINCFPNPFSEKTTMGVNLEKDANVNIHIMDIQGKIISVLCDKKLSAGNYRFDWNGSNAPSGIYVARIVIGNQVLNKKLVKKRAD